MKIGDRVRITKDVYVGSVESGDLGVIACTYNRKFGVKLDRDGMFADDWCISPDQMELIEPKYSVRIDDSKPITTKTLTITLIEGTKSLTGQFEDSEGRMWDVSINKMYDPKLTGPGND